MNYGKILGLAALGVGAVAAAPFTGGGSILGAVTLAGSLAGAGTIAAAAGAGVAGAAAGYAMSRKEEEEKKSKENEIAKLKEQFEKMKKLDIQNLDYNNTKIFEKTLINEKNQLENLIQN